MIKATDVVVTVLDTDAIVKEIHKQLPAKVGTTYLVDSVAMYDKNVIIDHDCVYYFMCPRVHKGTIHQLWDVPVRIKVKEQQGHTVSALSEFYFTITPEAMPKYYKEVKSLKDFMGTRFDYNPRVKANMRGFLEAIEKDLTNAK